MSIHGKATHDEVLQNQMNDFIVTDFLNGLKRENVYSQQSL